jgi:serine/threonine protein kinase/tetratricopeptide (TPR) repeat protein
MSEPPLVPPGSGDEPTRDLYRDDPGARMIGTFRILRKLGEGGMGIVYEAEQQSPKRAVALKVIRGGAFVDEGQIKMFQREAHSLARLKHPSIAAIYEMGRTDDGQHFFAMELVRGETLADWLKRDSSAGDSDQRIRLGLFCKIGDAVAYAHQRGVVHRDLKPSNILVLKETSSGASAATFGSPDVKILDFGLARITDGDVAMSTVVSELGSVKGTLPYMSPEQVRGNPDEIDLRTDVYSLGVILYELMTGRLPYDIGRAGLPEAVRVICDEPPRPLTSTASRSKRLDRDVATIVLKALEKEPGRRYQTVATLTDEVRRYLSDQPILARPPSAVYQLRKLVARHKVGFGFVASMFIVLTAFAATMTVQSRRIARERDRANREAAASKQVSRYLVDLFHVSDPSEARGETITARELLDKASSAVDGQLSEQPELRAQLAAIMGEVYLSLGLVGRADTLSSKSLDIRSRTLGAEHPDTLTSMNDVANVHFHQGRFADAEQLHASVLATRTRTLGPEHADTLASMNDLASDLTKQGRLADAERLLTQALEIEKRVLGIDHQQALVSMHRLANVYYGQAKYADTERLFVEVLEIERRVLGPEHPDTLGTTANLAAVYEREGRFADALPLASQVLEIRKRVLGPEHPDTLLSMNNLANIFNDLRRFPEAERLHAQVLEIETRVLGPEHPATLQSMNNLADVYKNEGRLPEAEQIHAKTLALKQKVLGPTNPETLVSMYNLGCLRALQGDRAGAMSWLRKVVDGGFQEVGIMTQDPDLKSLRGPELDALVASGKRGDKR